MTDSSRGHFIYWVGHALTGDGIDCGRTLDLSQTLASIQETYGPIINMHTPISRVVGFTTYQGYRIAFVPTTVVWPQRDEEISEWTEGAW